MMSQGIARMQGAALVVLRTLIGWHFLYEGYYKLMLPGWSRDGHPLPRWTSAGYLKASSGPFASLFNRLADSSLLDKVDLLVIAGLVLVGLSLMLGLFTQAGCVGALALLTLFYLAAIPVRGVVQPGAEGAYLVVNKTLIEAAAVFVVFAFRTGRIAGLDGLRAARTLSPRTEVVAS
jgi:thiosulfate dehydrogenase [quinone] large subunit